MVEQISEAILQLSKTQAAIADRLSKANLDRPDVKDYCQSLIQAMKKNDIHLERLTNVLNEVAAERYEPTGNAEELPPEQEAAAATIVQKPMRTIEEVVRDMQQRDMQQPAPEQAQH